MKTNHGMTEEKVEESSPTTAAADCHNDGNGNNNNTIIIVENLAAAIEKEIAQDIQESSRCSTMSSSPFTTADNTIRSWLVDNTNNYFQSTKTIKKDENLRYKLEVIMRDCAAFINACYKYNRLFEEEVQRRNRAQGIPQASFA